jgi:hypothetical protein
MMENATVATVPGMLRAQKKHQVPKNSNIAKKVNTCWFGFRRTARSGGKVVSLSTKILEGFTPQRIRVS